MKFFRFVLGRSGRAQRLLLGAIIAGALSGLASVALLDLLKRALDAAGKEPMGHLAELFVGLCIVVTGTRVLSQWMLTGLGQQLVMDLRLELGQQIVETPLRQLESLGTNRLLATLTDDINSLTQALVMVPVLCVNGTIILGCFGYLAWLDLRLFAVFTGLVLLGILIYRVLTSFAMRRFRKVREEQDELYMHFRGLGEGVKELQLHRDRRVAFLEQVRVTADSMRQLRVSATMIFGVASAWGNLLFFVTLGLIFFVLPADFTQDPSVLVTFTVVLFYVMTPLQIFLDTMPNLGRADVAVEKVKALGFTLAPSDSSASKRPRFESWQRLELEEVTHSYRRDDQEHPFTLGPINLTLTPGEVLFVVGGNGSGKTTLAKVLVGLYSPEAGTLRLDGDAITNDDLDAYRQLFSVVFDDFYLFEHLLGLAEPSSSGAAGTETNLDDRAREYLEALRIAHKVEVEDGKLSTLELSKGQRKRLALMVAYLENRPIYLFDEWAADQDPVFKEIFYRQILPELRRLGKAVIVISHDDRYFALADRLLKLEDGQVTFLGQPESEVAALPA